MTQKVSSGEQDKELSWEEAVSRYLDDHPDFFQRHADVLAKLNLRHEVGDGTASLIERQVRVLREQNETSQRQLRELVSVARENDVLAERLHRFALAMADSASLDDVFDNAYEMLRREFKIDVVAVLCQGEAEPAFARTEFVGDDPRLKSLLREYGVGKPVCGSRFDEDLLKYLFKQQAAELRSAALITLGKQRPLGILALGSHDARRFHSGMGTVYLAKLGDILMHSIARVTPVP
ncbi:MAG: DUF484 family protein [Gammaproteobacteria bacterium]|nr:DUF484 family protein [Gammaproteobacteria bacterium]